MTNRIDKQIDLKAPVSKVWRALTDHNEFGKWFQVKVDAPFVAGEPSTGHMTYPGFEHVKWDAVIQKIEPETLFSYTWHPAAVEADVDYSAETPTLVEFRLEPTPTGTRLLLSETGFENVPAGRMPEAYRMNDGGWTSQLDNIKNYVE